MLLNKQIEVDTITESGETFDLDLVISFSINNHGKSTAILSYESGQRLLNIAPGTARNFPGDSGFVWNGKMRIDFLETGKENFIEIVKGVTSTREY